MAQVSLNYHRPGVKGREVFGGLIQYDRIWRAGANENTTITFSHEAIIGGKIVPPGTYGLHIIPSEGNWTLIISGDHNSWGSYFYDKSKDVARGTGKTSNLSESVEWLEYGFENIGSEGADLTLSWANTKASFPISFDMEALTLNYIQNEYLKGLAGFYWDGFNNAALYCANNNVALESGIAWVDQSLNVVRNFTNVSTKSYLLFRQGNEVESEKLMNEALAMGNETEINMFGYTYFQHGEIDRAISMFEHNTKTYPKSWNVWDSLGEAQAAKGDKKSAIKNYKKALSMAPDENQKERITQIISGLES